jgi:hypothetical protein
MATKATAAIKIGLPTIFHKRQVAVPYVLLKLSPTQVAFRRMNYLHHVAVGDIKSKHHTSDAARQRYQRMLVGFFVQSLLAPTTSLTQCLGQYNDYIKILKEFDGTESVLLTLLLASKDTPSSPIVDRTFSLWKDFGPPPHLGAGENVAPFCIVPTKSLSYLSAKELSELPSLVRHRFPLKRINVHV